METDIGTYLNTVVAVGIEDEAEEIVWIGTGFLYGYLMPEESIEDKKEGESRYRLYLVTNKHIVKETFEYIFVRLTKTMGRIPKFCESP